jgi:hypothetical protein
MWYVDNDQIQYAPDKKKCIDGGDLKPGSKLQIWDCNGQGQQLWQVR